MADVGLGDFETVVKVIVIGNGGVGKSTMTARYCKGIFTDTYKKTVGVDFLEKEIEVTSLGETVRLMIWDTAGQEEFADLTSSYYRGAGACAVVFSMSDRASFEALDNWRRKLQEQVGESISVALVQNKTDLPADQKVVTDEEAAAVAARWGVPLFRTSVKLNENVDALFTNLATRAIGGAAAAAAAGGAGAAASSAAVPAMGSLSGQGGSAAAPAVDAAAAASVPPSPSSAASAGSGPSASAATPTGASTASRTGASGTSPIAAAGVGATAAGAGTSPASARKETVIAAEDEERRLGAAVPAAAATAASAAAAPASRGAALQPPPLAPKGSFKLTAEEQINKKKKKSWC